MSKEKYLNFIFTRYLYEKEEVEIALLLSLLYKKEKETLFWVYELYYSGFEQELWNLLWNIFIEFYASSNPGFETYLIKKHKEFIKCSSSNEREKVGAGILYCVVQNLFIRPFNMDVFLLKQIHANFELNIDNSSLSSLNENKDIIEKLFKEDSNLDWEKLLNIIYLKDLDLDLDFCIKFLKDLTEYLNLDLQTKCKKILNTFEKTSLFLSSNVPFIDKKTFLLSKILNIYGYFKKKKMGKNIYVSCDESNEFNMYETINADQVLNLCAYKILEQVRIVEIDNLNSLSLFHLKRDNLFLDIREAFLNHWLYHASKSPVWLERIHQYKGKVLEEEKKVVFLEEGEGEEDDVLLQAFYDCYGYEPDEQKKEVQDKSIALNNNIGCKKTWFQVYKELGVSSRFLEIDEEYLEQLEKVAFMF
jgi:hypothetical protein